MPHPTKHILILCLLLISSLAYAGRPMGPFRFELIGEDSVYQQGAVMEFTLRITNWDEFNVHPLRLPGPKYTGRKFIYLTAHTDDGDYTEIAHEAGTGFPDTAADVYTYQLEPGKHLDIRLKLYSKPRYAVVPSEPHWFSKPLGPGRYQLQAWYEPYEDLEMTGRAHRGTEDRSQYNGHSDYFRIEITPLSPHKYGKLDLCRDDCSFCRDIEKGKWNKVKRSIETKVKARYKTTGQVNAKTATRGYWLEQHRNVAYISQLPNAIQSSLPAYWGHIIGFKSGDSVHYYNMVVQFGRVFRGRGKLQTIAYWMFRSQRLFRTTDEDYIGLKYFRPIPAPNLFPVSGN